MLTHYTRLTIGVIEITAEILTAVQLTWVLTRQVLTTQNLILALLVFCIFFCL